MKTAILILCISSTAIVTGCANGGVSGGTDGWNGRIDISDVNGRNWERFVAQVERDVPVGTPVEDLERYLSDNGIRYTRLGRSFASSKHTPPPDGLISFGIRDILRNQLFPKVVGWSSGLNVTFYFVHEEGDVPRVSGMEGGLLNTFF